MITKIFTSALDCGTIIVAPLLTAYAVSNLPNQRIGICLFCVWASISALQRLSNPPELEDL
jgi:hypothetical protein